jgi:hypothetical protein
VLPLNGSVCLAARLPERERKCDETKAMALSHSPQEEEHGVREAVAQPQRKRHRHVVCILELRAPLPYQYHVRELSVGGVKP